MAYDINDAERVTFTYRKNGALADPTVVTATITTPAGVPTTYTYGTDAALVRDSTGVYHIDITFTAAGTWTVEGHGTGAVTGGGSRRFVVGLVNAYGDFGELAEWIGGNATTSDPQLQRAGNAAARAIDGLCGQRFWKDPAPVARTFAARGYCHVKIGNLATTTSLIVESDASGDGTFETTWAAGDYQLLPFDAAYADPEPRPYTSLRTTGTRSIPINYGTGRADRLRITGYWGWPAVPEAVTQAWLIKAARLYQRKNSLSGIAAFDDFGPVRISKAEDGDVILLLANYGGNQILIA